MKPSDFRNAISKQCGFNAKQGETTNKANSFCEALAKQKPYALQVCNAGNEPDDLDIRNTETPYPESFSDWLASNNDSIDIGGNWTPDRVEANKAQYDKLPF